MVSPYQFTQRFDIFFVEIHRLVRAVAVTECARDRRSGGSAAGARRGGTPERGDFENVPPRRVAGEAEAETSTDMHERHGVRASRHERRRQRGTTNEEPCSSFTQSYF